MTYVDDHFHDILINKHDQENVAPTDWQKQSKGKINLNLISYLRYSKDIAFL